MKVTMIVNGQEITYANVQDIKIIEETDKKADGNTTLLEDHPLIQGDWFYVCPKQIDRKLFEKELEGRGNPARRLILEAFEELEKNPSQYARDFKVRIPKSPTSFHEKRYNEIARTLKESDEHIANWVELALMWAQRIHNGEPWEVLHNYMFTVSKYPRFIIWKDGFVANAGGSLKISSVFNYPEQYILLQYTGMSEKCFGEVPIIARNI